jgi:hypothetical protein
MVGEFRPNHITATGNVGLSNGGFLGSASVTAAAALATLTLRENGSTGSIILLISAPVGASNQWFNSGGDGYQGKLHATLTGAGATGNVEI